MDIKKRKYIVKLLIFFVLIFSFFLFLEVTPVVAQCMDEAACRSMGCGYPACSGCPWCGGPPSSEKITNPSLSNSIQNLSGVEFISRLLPNIITIAFIIAVLVAIIALISGGIKWITSGGDREALGKAQGTITAAIIGLVIIFSLYAVLKLIGYFFGIELINIDISNLIL